MTCKHTSGTHDALRTHMHCDVGALRLKQYCMHSLQNLLCMPWQMMISRHTCHLVVALPWAERGPSAELAGAPAPADSFLGSRMSFTLLANCRECCSKSSDTACTRASLQLLCTSCVGSWMCSVHWFETCQPALVIMLRPVRAINGIDGRKTTTGSKHIWHSAISLTCSHARQYKSSGKFETSRRSGIFGWPQR